MFLSKVELLPKFNTFIRQISRGSTLLKQAPSENAAKPLEKKSKEEEKVVTNVKPKSTNTKTTQILTNLFDKKNDDPKDKLLNTLGFLKNEQPLNQKTSMKGLFDNIKANKPNQSNKEANVKSLNSINVRINVIH